MLLGIADCTLDPLIKLLAQSPLVLVGRLKLAEERKDLRL
jgi:hypothetical protein